MLGRVARCLPFLCALLALPALGARAEEPPTPVYRAGYAFQGEAESGFTGAATGEAARRMPGPKLSQGRLYLLESWAQSSAAVAFPAPAPSRTRRVEGAFRFWINTGTEGMGFLWVCTEAHGGEPRLPEIGAWEAPDLAGSFGIGLDASNPPNRDPFRGSGNAYDRPQHEISLHFDGLERVKRTTPTDFRDEQPHELRFRIEFVTGGAEISLWLDGTMLFDGWFMPRMAAYHGRPCFGARNGETAGDVLLDDVEFRCEDPLQAPPPPKHVVLLDHVINDKQHPRNEATVQLPQDTSEYGRILLTLRLDKPSTRFDPWDRLAHVYAYADDGERFEILRYVTPYHRGHEWTVDVSAYRPLLRGNRRIEQVCGTQGEGWVVSIALEYHPGPAERLATHVRTLWSGAPVIGNPDKPLQEFFVPRQVEIPEGTSSAEVRAIVTGHGMSPNSNNAAEFMPIERTLTVNDKTWTNRLWKTDCYLNPCRPQGGTWKYDRAGWAPGDVVTPWIVPVDLPSDPARLQIQYALAPYVNENRGQTWEPFHQTEVHVVFYRTP